MMKSDKHNGFPGQSQSPAQIRVLICASIESSAQQSRVEQFKHFIAESPLVKSVVPGLGSFDLIIEVSAEEITAYHEWKRCFDRLSTDLLRRKDETFISGTACTSFVDRVIWVPESGGRKSLDVHLIDKVTAEGDYVRVHCGDHSWLVHTTMRSFSELLADNEFIRLHRSAIVRREAIEGLERVGQRWSVHLKDGSDEFVARGQAANVLRQIGVHSSMISGISSTIRT
jgi:hypothetical protein